MGCSETGFAKGLVWMRESEIWLFPIVPAGVREECSESLATFAYLSTRTLDLSFLMISAAT